MHKKKPLLILTIIFAIVAWVSDSFFDYLISRNARFLDVLLLVNVTSHEVYYRILLVLLIASFGLLISELYLRRTQVEEKLKLALEGAELCTWSWDIQTGDIFFDDCWARIFGYELTEIPSRLNAFEQLIHPEDLPQIRSLRQSDFENKSPFFELEYRLRNKTGHWIWLLDRGKIVDHSKTGQPLRAAGTLLDITARKNVEEAFRREKENLTNVMQSMSDGVYIASANHEILYHNPAIKKEFGEAGQKKCYDYFHKRKSPCPWCYLERVLEGESKRSQRYYPIRQKTFDIIDTPLLNPDGSTAKLQILRDITEQKLAEEALRLAKAKAEAEKNKTEAILAALGDGLMIVSEKYRVIYQNQVHLDMLGDHQGTLCYQTIGDSQKVCQNCALTNSFQDGQVHRTEKQITLGNQIHYFDITASPLKDANGNIIAGIEVMRNITLRKLAEKTLKQRKKEVETHNQELKLLDKIKDGLVRDVSHELKTPLAKHNMQLEIFRLLLNEKPDNDFQNILNKMQQSLKRQEEIIHNILDLSRLEAGGRRFKQQEVWLDQILLKVISDYDVLIEAHEIKLTRDLPHLPIISDSDMLYHVFSNLLNNAIKYRSQVNPRRINISLSEQENKAMIKIEDNGIGMTEQQFSKAFERFYQASPASEGTGVGLAIVKMIMEGLGGNISLRSEGKDRGSTAIVTLFKNRRNSNEKDSADN